MIFFDFLWFVWFRLRWIFFDFFWFFSRFSSIFSIIFFDFLWIILTYFEWISLIFLDFLASKRGPKRGSKRARKHCTRALEKRPKRASKRGSFGRPIFEGCLEREHHFWEPVVAMNGKRVARKGMRIQAKEIGRKQKSKSTFCCKGSLSALEQKSIDF